MRDDEILAGVVKQLLGKHFTVTTCQDEAKPATIQFHDKARLSVDEFAALQRAHQEKVERDWAYPADMLGTDQ